MIYHFDVTPLSLATLTTAIDFLQAFKHSMGLQLIQATLHSLSYIQWKILSLIMCLTCSPPRQLDKGKFTKHMNSYLHYPAWRTNSASLTSLISTNLFRDIQYPWLEFLAFLTHRIPIYITPVLTDAKAVMSTLQTPVVEKFKRVRETWKPNLWWHSIRGVLDCFVPLYQLDVLFIYLSLC